MPQKCHRHMAPLTINMRTPLSKRPKNSPPQERGSPHQSEITNQQTHPILHTNKCMQPQQHKLTTNCPILAHRMHMPTNKVPLPSKTKTRHPLYTRSPKSPPTPLLPTHAHTIQFIDFTYCHDRFPEQALTQKHAKYDPLINAIRNKGGKTNPLITITSGVRGAIHEQSIDKLADLWIPKSNIKTLMKSIHQNVSKYLTYLVLNKNKFDNKQHTIAQP